MAAIENAPALTVLPHGSTVHWAGTDDLTPAGHFIAVGVDPLGNTTEWVVTGTPDTPGAVLGRVVLDKNPTGPAHFYTGSYHMGTVTDRTRDYAAIVEQAAAFARDRAR